jgi:hypothetical protein
MEQWNDGRLGPFYMTLKIYAFYSETVKIDPKNRDQNTKVTRF